MVGIHTVAPGDYRDALPGLQALAHHGQLLLRAPAPPLLTKQFAATLIVTVSHKHTRLPTPYLPVYQGLVHVLEEAMFERVSPFRFLEGLPASL